MQAINSHMPCSTRQCLDTAYRENHVALEKLTSTYLVFLLTMSGQRNSYTSTQWGGWHHYFYCTTSKPKCSCVKHWSSLKYNTYTEYDCAEHEGTESCTLHNVTQDTGKSCRVWEKIPNEIKHETGNGNNPSRFNENTIIVAGRPSQNGQQR